MCILICIHLACNSPEAVHLCFLVYADSWAGNTCQIAVAKVYHISTLIYNSYNNNYTYLTDTTQKNRHELSKVSVNLPILHRQVTKLIPRVLKLCRLGLVDKIRECSLTADDPTQTIF